MGPTASTGRSWRPTRFSPVRRTRRPRIIAGPLTARPHHMALVDGVRALLPHLSADFRLFGCSADLLRHGVAEASNAGLVLEFGVRRGTSITHIAEAAGQPVHGFDSFEGLPEGWGSQPQGSFTTELELPPVPANAMLHAGWFEDTLARLPGRAARPGAVRQYRLRYLFIGPHGPDGAGDACVPAPSWFSTSTSAIRHGASTSTRRSRSSSRKPR